MTDETTSYPVGQHPDLPPPRGTTGWFAITTGEDRRLCDLGRTSALLGERSDAIDWAALRDPGSSEEARLAAERSLDATQGVLGDLNTRLERGQDILTPELATLVREKDPAGVAAALDKAVLPLPRAKVSPAIPAPPPTSVLR